MKLTDTGHPWVGHLASLLRMFTCSHSQSLPVLGALPLSLELLTGSSTVLTLRILFLKENYNLCFYRLYPLSLLLYSGIMNRANPLQPDHHLGLHRQLSGVYLSVQVTPLRLLPLALTRGPRVCSLPLWVHWVEPTPENTPLLSVTHGIREGTPSTWSMPRTA